MNELSHRLSLAIDFLKRNGYARSDVEIARKLGIYSSALNMAKKGERAPTWGMLLDFCDNYPISFWWLRSGEGDMIGNGDRTIALLKKIEELEKRVRELENRTLA